MALTNTRWTVATPASAVRRCRMRNDQGIRCILHALGEYAGDAPQTFAALNDILGLFRTIEQHRLQASVSVKLSELGALFDRDLCREHVMTLASEAASRHIGLEFDMEGTELTSFTLDTARYCAREGFAVTVALQAYLERTGSDLEMLIRNDIRPRLVKGAYAGDYDDDEAIRNRLKHHVLRVRDTAGAISVGTHDPLILGWIADTLRDERHRIHLGFLMGLADATKEGLAGAGWRVWEYVPVGSSSRPYILRRERYLAEHRVRGTAPAP